MPAGTDAWSGAVPLLGEHTIEQTNAAVDISTVQGASGQTGDFVSYQDVNGTEKFVVTAAGILETFGLRRQNKTANYTVVAGDSGTVFTTTGDTDNVVFTLPTPAAGLWFLFVSCANTNMTVAAATANTLITFNDLTADSVAFSTANEKIGGMILVVCDGTSFIANKIGGNTMTVA